MSVHFSGGRLGRAAGLAVWCVISCVAGAAAQTPVAGPWVSQDIGAPAIAGDATGTQSSFTITAGGEDIWGTSDQFHFVYTPVSGDVDVRARVDSVTATDRWSKAGVMIRGSLSASAPHALALVSNAQGIAFQRRRSSGAVSLNTAGPLAAAPAWVRLVRAGTQVTAYTSTDGSNWKIIGSDTIQLGTNAYVGIAVTSHNAGAATTAKVSQVSFSQSQSSALPSGQADADLGNPALKGTVSFSSGTYTIKAAGTDIWGSADQFHYVYQQASGDLDVAVRLASIAAADQWSKAGVMIRETLTAGSTHAFALVSSSRGYAFQRRATTNGQSDNTAGWSKTAPGWVRLKRSGDMFTAYESTDGTTWTVIGSDSIPMADNVYVGIAATSHTAAAYTTATADHFTVTGTQTTTNQPPTVAFTSPANGSTFTAPANITLQATASDPEGKLARVEFYNGSTLVNSDTAAPFSYSWSSVAAGTYTLTAKAYDTAGATATASITVTVTSGTTNKPPTVSLTSPTSGASFTAPASITLTASASDPENQLAKVEFYSGSTLLGTDTSAPYSVTASSLPAGTYTFTAKAYDAAGATATSSGVSVTVGSVTNKPPTVSLTSPTSGTTYTAPASITLTANASDPENQLAKVEFYSGSTLLGTDTSAPYSFIVSSVPNGTYTLTAKAYDAKGATATSSPVTITVGSSTTVPTGVAFQKSADDATLVTSYRLEVFAASANVNTGTPLSTYDAGKPAADSTGTITVSAASFFTALPAGTYQLVVAAVGQGGVGLSAAVTFAR